MIFTCTLNPSVDYLVKVDQFQEGELNRTNGSQFFPGGKGINVSRVLKRLGVDSTALGFIGGFTGDFILDRLTQEKICTDFVEISGHTRVNVKLKSRLETEINGEGADISLKQSEQLLDKIKALHHDDIVVISGSIPKSLPNQYYTQMASICEERHIRFVLDTSSPSFLEMVKYQPFLVKPNQYELGGLFGVHIESVADAVNYGKKLLELGPQHVIVSMGGKGAVFLAKERIWIASVPSKPVKNSVGAGDSLVAGFLSRFSDENDQIEAFRYAVAAGSATAFSEDLCEKVTVEQLVNEIELRSGTNENY